MKRFYLGPIDAGFLGQRAEEFQLGGGGGSDDARFAAIDDRASDGGCSLIGRGFSQRHLVAEHPEEHTQIRNNEGRGRQNYTKRFLGIEGGVLRSFTR